MFADYVSMGKKLYLSVVCKVTEMWRGLVNDVTFNDKCDKFLHSPEKNIVVMLQK